MNETITKKDLKDALDNLTVNLCKRMDERFESIDRRFDAVDQRFETMDQKFERMDRRFEAIDQKFDRLETKVDSISEDLEDLALMTKVQFDDLDRKIAILGARTRGLGIWS
ncbi:hypothetical protein HY733_02900 [Candidatus Uhrbacteria bacterium]|nr:hypothetical protein [Candidatus Uhrbacteria bacterium]